MKTMTTSERNLLSPAGATVVIRIGGPNITVEEAGDGVISTLHDGLGRAITPKSVTTLEIVGGQLRSFRPNTRGIRREYDIVVQVA